MVPASQDPCEDNEGVQEITPGLVGLQNLGNTCYMNGALQALSNCQQLTRFVLDCPGLFRERERALCHGYSDLIKQIWVDGSSQYAVPTNIIRNIKCIYPAFRGCTQQDTQEFLRCFLEQLHDELKKPIPAKCGKSNLSTSDVDTNVESKFNRHEDHPNLTECSIRTIISDTFEFQISSSVVCSSCNNISTTKESFKDLSIPIPTKDHQLINRSTMSGSLPRNNGEKDVEHEHGPETDTNTVIEAKSTNSDKLDDEIEDNEVKSELTKSVGIVKSDVQDNSEIIDSLYSESPMMTNWFWNWLYQLKSWFWGPTVTLDDCLSLFFGTDALEGENEYSCEVCTKKNRGVKYLKILELPEVLCIHFKRYESVGSTKITTHVSFPLVGLDLTPYMSEGARNQCTTYKLIACICHHGSALLTGHYTTYALNCYDDQWYEFDDQYVTHVDQSQVENCEAYILFYQKSSLNDDTNKQREKASQLLQESLSLNNTNKYFISKQWVNKFNTFVEPGPITNYDFLCEHEKVPKNRQPFLSDLCHPVSENVWNYLKKLHGGGPDCQELQTCDICD